MQQAANFIRGWVELQVTGDSPEEFFNLCARQGLGFWRPRKGDKTTWTCRVSFLDWPRVAPLAQRTLCQVKLLRRSGVPGFLWKLRYRYALLAGLVLCLTAVGVMSRFVLTVQVSGNESVSTAAILTQLRAQGVRPGAFGPGLDTRQISHAVMLELPELSWMAINLHGTVCQVLVREGTPKPDILPEDKPAHIIAKYPGIITHIDTTSGQQLVEKGDTVAAGDTLIGSWVDFVEPQYYDGDMGGMTVRATGRVRARTWHTLQASMPLESQVKVLTGREKTRWSLEIFGQRVKFYPKGGIPYEKYDKIATYHTAVLPGGRVLPLSLKRTVCREYATESANLDREAAVEVLRQELGRRLATLADQEDILRVDWQVDETDSMVTLTLLAECEQEIGVTVEE